MVLNHNIPSESREQRDLFRWAKMRAATCPELNMLAAVPNGGHRDPITGAIMKAEGTAAGYPDILLDVARGGYHGLRIELKRRRGGRLSAAQRDWLDRLARQGYCIVVCRGCHEAISAIENYLGMGER